MASKAEKKRNRKATRGLGSSKAGRPRADGERYPGGKLKPRRNDRAIEARRAIVGEGMDIALADDPLDFIHAKGWLSTARYRAALAYRDIRRQARLGGPRLDAGGVQETASTTGLVARSVSDMTSAEITEVFDHVFREAPATTAEEREAAALQRWKRVEAAMSPVERHQVGMICVDLSWTFWITALNMGHELVGRRLADRQAFERGLDAIRAALKPSVKATAERAMAVYETAPQRPVTTAPKRLVDVQYVDEDGEPVAMISQRGRGFSVAKKVR